MAAVTGENSIGGASFLSVIDAGAGKRLEL